MSTTETFLIAMVIILGAPYLVWRLGGTDYWAPLVVVQIVTGILFGPGILGKAFPEYYQFVFNGQVVQALSGVAWWGVMVFVWLAGVELDLGKTWAHRRESAVTAGLALGVPLACGSVAALAMLATPGWLGARATSWQFVVGVGISCAVTALPILILLLEKLEILRQPIGQRILRYASLDDIAIWGVLALILMDWERAGKQVAFLAVFALLAWGYRRLMAVVPMRDRWHIALIWLALAALGADWSGLHFMVGAFLAGLVTESEWFEQKQVDALRQNVLLTVMPVYFLSTGLRTNWGCRWQRRLPGRGRPAARLGRRQAARRPHGRTAARLGARRGLDHRLAAADQGADHDHLRQHPARQADHHRRDLHGAAADGRREHDAHRSRRRAAALAAEDARPAGSLNLRVRKGSAAPRIRVVEAVIESPSKPLLAHALWLSALAGSAPFAMAQKSAPPAQLDTVVVTASRSDTRLQDMPLHTTVITQEEIRQSPAQTLDQLLRNVPGLLVPGAPAYTTDPTGANIKFRGMDKKVLVLVDGVPVLDPFYTTIQWFKVPLSSIERVEVVRGGGSSLWGNLAVGGVINIVSKHPTSNDGEASLSIGSMNTWTAALSRNFVVSKALSFNLSADGFRSGGYNNTAPELRGAFWPGRGKSSASSRNLRLGVFFHPSDDFSGFLRIGYHEQNEDIGGYAFGTNLQKSPDLQGGLTKILDARSRLEAKVYAQRVHFDKYNGAGCYAAASFACGASVSGRGASPAQQASPTLQYASSYDLNTYRERGGSLVYSRSWQGLLEQMQIGIDYRGISGEDAQQSYRTPTAARPDAFRIQRANDGAGAQDFTGIFSQFKLRPFDPLELTFGARVDRFSSSDGRAIQTNYADAVPPVPPVASAPTGGPVPGISKTAFDPSVSLRYDVSDQLDLRGSVYKAFRAPGLNNLYRSFGSSSITIANPLLGPETLVGKEIGLDWKGRGYSLSATLFQADVRNVVATYAITASTPIPAAVQNICGAAYAGAPNTSCPGTVTFYTNGQDQRARGIELDGKWAVSRSVNLGAYATATQTFYTRTTTGDPTHVQLSLVPKVVAGGNLSWQASEQWASYVDLRYNSPMTLSSLTLAPALRQGAYAVVNAGSSYRVSKLAEVFASVVNLFNRHYTDASASNPQGISYALPRALTLGLRARF